MKNVQVAFYWCAVLLMGLCLYGVDIHLDDAVAEYRKKVGVKHWMLTVQRQVKKIRGQENHTAIEADTSAGLLAWIKQNNSWSYEYITLTLEVDPKTGTVCDPWGNPVVARKVGEGELLLLSYGPNGQDDDGQGDDITQLVNLQAKPKAKTSSESKQYSEETSSDPSR